MALNRKVAVLLPTYNGARYLAAQLDSILGQTLKDIEVVAVDDGSRDDTVDMLSDYARRDTRVTVRADGFNRGQRARLAEALGASSAPYVAVADQDDVWAPAKLETLSRHLDAGAMMAFGPSHLIDGEGVDLGTTLLDAIGTPYHPQSRLASLFMPIVSAHATLVRREGFTAIALQRGTVPFDALMALDAIWSDGLVYDEAATVQHRIHGANQSNGDVLTLKRRFDATDGRLLPWQIRQGLWGVNAHRMDFLAKVDHLANSAIVPPRVSDIFHTLRKDCDGAWFNAWRPLTGAARALERKTHAALLSYSAGPTDLAFFMRRFHQLQYTPPHPKAFAIFMQRTRTGDFARE